MPADSLSAGRALVAIPAYNEVMTIAAVIGDLRRAAPEFDLLVVDDGSRDGTAAKLATLGVRTATHLCNLGYGRTLQTAIRYAERAGYDALITFDADGQHRAEDIAPLYRAFREQGLDFLIGSRFLRRRDYAGEPLLRQMGMRLFSTLISLLAGRRIYDTTSGLKVVSRRLFAVLVGRPFVDFHAEVLVYLIKCGYRVGEFPISVESRSHGTSMYTGLSALKYPLKVSLLILLGALEARRNPRRLRV